jgi:lysophospholipase L1-like esterase
VLANLDTWVISRQPDIVHINCGLHDIRRAYDSDARAIPLDAYTSNVRQILTRIQQKTEATVIWAATTPVNYERHHEVKGFDRFESDVDAYNAAAAAIASALAIPINDLFSVIMNAGRDALLTPDGVHFWGPGYDLLGKAVADCIQQYL